QPAGAVELEMALPHGPVGADDVLVVVLPQLVAVTCLDVGEALVPVVVERGGVGVLVLQEFVRLRPVPAVAIAHDDVPRPVIDGLDASTSVRLREALHGLQRDHSKKNSALPTEHRSDRRWLHRKSFTTTTPRPAGWPKRGVGKRLAVTSSRSTSRTPAGSGAGGPARSRGCTCSRCTSR